MDGWMDEMDEMDEMDITYHFLLLTVYSVVFTGLELTGLLCLIDNIQSRH